jgi:uncharacterized protein YkwD
LLKNTVRRIALLASLPAVLVSLVVTGTPANAAMVAPTATERTLISHTNTARARAGCAAVHVNYQLTYAARAHSRDMVVRNYFGHRSPSGTNFVMRAKAAGYNSPMSENIGWGYRTSASLFNAWMQSPGHRANIVNCSARAVGIGIAYKANGTPYYTQIFGRV